MKQAWAETTLSAATYFTLGAVTTVESALPGGTVVSQSPSAYAKPGFGATVSVAVSTGPTVCATRLSLSGVRRAVVGKPRRLNGAVAPTTAKGSVKITLRRRVGGAWKTVCTGRATIAGGRFSYSFKPRYRGSWRAIAAYPGQTVDSVSYEPSIVTRSFRVR